VPAAPGSDVSEGGKGAADSPGVRFVGREADRTVYSIESGSYTFESRL
jgi:hypothetical protein